MSEAKFKFGDRVVHNGLNCVVVHAWGERQIEIRDENGTHYSLSSSQVTSPPPPPNTVPVRIAVAVCEDGEWAADGASNQADAESIMQSKYFFEPGERDELGISWITAHVPLPAAPAEVEGRVEG